ncbi:MAG: sporulation protein [Clostridiales bacterium]|jgi:uncharacterized spore protein YtfJ|nr:sporulation protein [Clostridiales bacterium]
MSVNLSNNLDTLFNKMESIVSTKTVVGTPIHLDGVIIVPLVEVSFGVGAGMSDSRDDKGKEGGGAGLGGHITPSAVLVVIDGNVQLVSVKNEDSVKKLIDLVPGILSKLNLSAIFGKKNKADKKEAENVVEFEETKVYVTPDEANCPNDAETV